MLTLGAAAAVLLNPLSAVALMNSNLGTDIVDVQRLALLNFLHLAVEAGILIKVGGALAQLAQADTLVLSAAASHQPEAATVIKALRSHFSGIYLLITSAHPFSQRRLRELNADGVLLADTDAAQAPVIAHLQQTGKCVCYVGDGVADTPAMQSAFMPISLCCSKAQAIDAAQLLLLGGNLQQLVTLWGLAAEFKRTQASAVQLTFATGALNLTSVLFFHSGLIPSFLFNTVGLLGAMTCAMLPTTDYDLKKLSARWQNDLQRQPLGKTQPAQPSTDPLQLQVA
jgi:cation transport ATPase